MSLTVNRSKGLLAQRRLNETQKNKQRTFERLSSGLRINSAKDDAAGLSIATRLGSNFRGLEMAMRNANDGIDGADSRGLPRKHLGEPPTDEGTCRTSEQRRAY